MSDSGPEPTVTPAVVRDAALRAWDAGLAVMPPVGPGKNTDPKAPIGAWKAHQSRRPDRAQVEAWYSNGRRWVGAITGRVSGNLEVLDFDDRETYEHFMDACHASGLGPLVDRIEAGYCEDSPKGVHWAYRCDVIAGNTRLASKADRSVKIETRGEGGYIVLAPTTGLHPGGAGYTLRSGSFSTIATITPEERKQLHQVARIFDDAPRPIVNAVPTSGEKGDSWATRPGDDYNARATWHDALPGWMLVHRMPNGLSLWRRPGKDHGWSATTGIRPGGLDLLHVFTSSTALEPGKNYLKYTAYTLLEHGGDFRSSARALKERGYGKGAEKAKEKAATKADAATEEKSKEYAGPLLVWASTITPRALEFLWPGRIPLGKMATFAGRGGIGKTFALCDVAARISTGSVWPECGGECAERGSVLFISGEDDEDDTLVPRLIELGADLDRVAFLAPEPHDDFMLAATDLLGRALDEMREDCRLIVIDPPTNFLGDADNHKDAEIRKLLRPYKGFLKGRRCSVIFNNHVNKAAGPNVEAHERVMGTVAWVNAVRSAHMFVPDQDNPDHTLFVTFKTNNFKKPKPLKYTIETSGMAAKLIWLGEVNATAEDAIRGAPKKGPQAYARQWLETVAFANQREWPSHEIRRAAAEAGISKRALWEAKDVLPIQARMFYTPDGTRAWKWLALEGWPKAGGNLGNLGNLKT